MDPRRWEQIAILYQAACEREAGERSKFVADASAGDEELRREVESLLLQDVSRDGVLERVADEASRIFVPALELMPENIGRYRILKRVGEGGMGVVFEAEQEHPHRTVALKVIKAGLASPELLRRFARESEALGRLQHPGIAQIYDAGAAETEFGSQPYFAMEFIRGDSLVEYAHAKTLDTRARLRLMVSICDAVQHAHQRGIIHRDLKPSNVLVDETGQPKVLDFGVARITDSDVETTRQTDLGQLVGTLAYMSPEQVLGDRLEADARSDIYSLGVMLYELLAERLPYEVSRNVYEAAGTIRDQDPTPLGRVRPDCRGDLELIVAKALEKDKTRRYASAAELGTDIRHFLDDQPILARPASAGYQIRKFAIRHKGVVGSAIAIFIILCAGLVGVSLEAIRANRAEHAALMERDRATQAERSATGERDRALRAEHAADRERSRAEQERNHAVEESHRADNEAATAKAVNDFLQNDLLSEAAAQRQSGPHTKPDSDLKVRVALDRAAAGINGKFKTQPAVEAAIRYTIGASYYDLGLLREAQPQLERALQLQRETLGQDHRDTLSTMGKLGVLYKDQGKFAASEPLLAKRVEIEQRIHSGNHPETLAALVDLADLANQSQGDYAKIEGLLVRVLEVQRRVLGAEHPDTLATMNDLGTNYVNQGKFAQAERLYKEAIDIKRRVLGDEHPSTLQTINNLGVTYRKEGKYTEAETQLKTAFEARRRVEGMQHIDTLASMNSLALLYEAEGKLGEAEPLLRQAVDTLRQVSGEERPDTLRFMNSLADLCLREGKRAEAEAIFQKVLEIRRRVLGPDHPNTARVLASLGEMKLEQGGYAAAEPFLRDAIKARGKSTPNAWERFYAQSMLGAALAGQGRYADAEPLLLSGYAGLIERESSIPADSRSSLDHIRAWIAQLYEGWGRPEQAVAWRDRTSKH